MNRSVSVTLRAAANQYISEVKRAAQATNDLSNAADKAEAASGKVGTSGSRAARQQQKAAREAQASWDQTASAMTQVGGVLTAAGAGALALAGAVAKTGIEYNTLQQTSRAALTTLTGSAEAANAQMDKLDAFAKTSPFAKQTFIQAQQQMLAFGIESKKVIPYLDAINDAVAATGGSSQQVGELAAIMAKIQSSAKITAEDLNQFGERGVDAAKLIGEQMGLTAGEIREKITSGTLDAGQALDALAAGMKERFGGAAANVKETMGGALDRVKAAWRDLSAAMMEPFVSAQGGGFLVDATNQLANFMRAVEALPGPVRASMGGLTALFGVAATGAGAFLLLVPRIVETRAAIETLRVASPAAAAGIDKLGGALGKAAKVTSIAVAGFGIVVTAMRAIEDNVPEFSEANMSGEKLATTMELIANNAASLDDVFQSNNRALFEMKEGGFTAAEAIGQLAQVHDSAGFAVDRFMSGLTGVNTMMVENEQRLIAYGDRLAELPLDQAQMLFAELKRTADEQGMSLEVLMGYTEGYADSVKVMAAEAGVADLSMQELSALMSGEMVRGLQLSADGTRLLSEEQAKAEGAASGMADAQAEAAAAAKEQAEAIEAAKDAINGYYDAVMAAEQGAMALEAAFDKANESVTENGKTLDIATEAGRANKGALLDIAEAGFGLAESMAAAGESTSSITGAVAGAREQFLQVAQAMGMSAAEAAAYADHLGLIPEEVATRFEQPNVLDAQSRADALNSLYMETPGEVATAFTQPGMDAAQTATAAYMAAVTGLPLGVATQFVQPGMKQAQSDTATLTGQVKNVPNSQSTAFSQPGMPNAQQQTRTYTGQIDAVPDSQSTTFTQPGIGNAKSQVSSYTGQVNSVPSSKTTTIRTVADLSGYYNVNNTLNSIAGKTVSTYIAVKRYGQGAAATGGYGADVAASIGLANGGMPPSTRRYSGLLSGPGTPTSDSIPAWLSRKEFVTKAAAVDYYGPSLMYALNAMAIPRDFFKQFGFANGGMIESPRYNTAPQPVYISPPQTERSGKGLTINSHVYYPVAEPASVREKALLDQAASVGLAGY